MALPAVARPLLPARPAAPPGARALAGRLGSVELNGSFYSLQRPESYRSWAARTPQDFLFSVKGPRFVTHLKQLRDVGTPVANFFASGVLALGAKLDTMAERIRGWRAEGLDVVGYFDNDTKVHAPFDAIALAERLAE